MCIVLLVICAVVFKRILMPVYIPTNSMEPTIKRKTFGFAYKLPFLLGTAEIDRGDVIIFRDENGKVLCKRVIGVPGDEITIKGGKLYINCELITEPYLFDNVETNSVRANYEVPEGGYFGLGDNRITSRDSMYWRYPFVRRERIFARWVFADWEEKTIWERKRTQQSSDENGE